MYSDREDLEIMAYTFARDFDLAQNCYDLEVMPREELDYVMKRYEEICLELEDC